MQWPWVTWALVLGACAGSTAPPAEDPSGQTFRAALVLICEVDRRAELTEVDDPIALDRQREEWLMRHVVNGDGIYLITIWRTQSAAEQARTLRRQAQAEGIARCPLADALEAAP
jgi:hypothetical protein